MSKEKFLGTVDFPDDIYGYAIKADVYGNQNNPGKVIETGDGTTIYTFPGQYAVISTDTDGDGTFTEQVTLNATGTFTATTLDDGSIFYDYRGHNVIYDPVDGGTPDEAWIKYAVGHFTYQSDADNNAILSLEGNGQLTEITDYFL